MTKLFGLSNVTGSNCYMSSPMQILLHTLRLLPDYTNKLTTEDFAVLNEKPVHKMIWSLIRDLRSNQLWTEFNYCVRSQIGRGYQDAGEQMDGRILMPLEAEKGPLSKLRSLFEMEIDEWKEEKNTASMQPIRTMAPVMHPVLPPTTSNASFENAVISNIINMTTPMSDENYRGNIQTKFNAIQQWPQFLWIHKNSLVGTVSRSDPFFYFPLEQILYFESPHAYQLYATISFTGAHWLSFVKHNGRWYELNDDKVGNVNNPEMTVLTAQTRHYFFRRFSDVHMPRISTSPFSQKQVQCTENGFMFEYDRRENIEKWFAVNARKTEGFWTRMDQALQDMYQMYGISWLQLNPKLHDSLPFSVKFFPDGGSFDITKQPPIIMVKDLNFEMSVLSSRIICILNLLRGGVHFFTYMNRFYKTFEEYRWKSVELFFLPPTTDEHQRVNMELFRKFFDDIIEPWMDHPNLYPPLSQTLPPEETDRHFKPDLTTGYGITKDANDKLTQFLTIRYNNN